MTFEGYNLLQYFTNFILFSSFFVCVFCFEKIQHFFLVRLLKSESNLYFPILKLKASGQSARSCSWCVFVGF